MLCALHGGTDHARSVLVTTESTYGARLRFWRDQARMSQAKLAAAAGMTERNIRHLETSAQRPYDDSHGRIAQALAPGLGWSDADLAEIRDRRCLPDLPVEGVSGQVAERGLSAEGVAGNGSGAATHGSALSGVATESYRTGGLSSRSLGPIPKRATPRVIDLTAAESLRLPPDAHSLPPGHAGARNRRRDFLRLALGVVVILISVSAAAATGRFDRGAHATTESARIQDPANRERVGKPPGCPRHGGCTPGPRAVADDPAAGRNLLLRPTQTPTRRRRRRLDSSDARGTSTGRRRAGIRLVRRVHSEEGKRI